MKKELKKRWIKALRSGDYTQANGYLQKDGKFCCLGVLCQIEKPELFELKPKLHPADVDVYGVPYEPGEPGTASGYLPNWIAKDFDLDPDKANLLARMNDAGKSFKAIADHIERSIQ